MRRIKGKDRRRFRRRELVVKGSVPATLRHSDGTAQTLKLAIIDISEGGVRVQVDNDLPAGEFNLALDIAHFSASLKGELILPCETVWKRHVAGSTWTYGLEFVTSRATCEVLTRVLQDLTAEEPTLQEV